VTFKLFIVTISLSCTVSEILALISQNFKRSRDLKCIPMRAMLQNIYNASRLLFTFNLQTKFEMPSFISSNDMAWATKCRNESRDSDHAHLVDS